MNNLASIKKAILDSTDGGLDAFKHYIHNLPENRKKHFKLRESEKTASASYKRTPDGSVIVKDFGDSDKAKNIFDFVMTEFNISFANAVKKIITDLSLPIDLGAEDIKDWKAPVFKNVTDLPESLVHKIFSERRISQEVIREAGLFINKNKFFTSVQKELPALVFPYRDRDGNVVNAKNYHLYKEEGKAPKKLYELEKNGKRIFYGLETIKPTTTKVIIVEGEWDRLSVLEAMKLADKTQYACISVSNGVSSLNDNLWFDADIFYNIEEIYIFVDNDAPGKKLELEIARRLGKYRCKIVSKYNYKDANDMLVKKGSNLVLDAILSAEFIKIENVISVSDFMPELESLYRGEIDLGAEVGFQGFDEVFRVAASQLTVISGVPNSAKSTFVDNMLVKLSYHHGWKHGIFSPEFVSDAYHAKQLAEMYLGKRYMMPNENQDSDRIIMTREEFVESAKFIDDHFKFIEPKIDHNKGRYELMTKEKIFDTMRDMVMRFGLDTVTIDPFNKISRGDKAYMDLGWINEFFQELNYFKKMYNIHIFLVAHPVKMNKVEEIVINGKTLTQYAKPGVYDIFGGSEIGNQTDNVLITYRDLRTNIMSVSVEKLKNRWNGILGGTQSFEFDPATALFEVATEDTLTITRKLNTSTSQEVKPTNKELKVANGGVEPFDDSNPPF